MNYEEKEMQERFGKGNPFRVPEGYFDQLTDRVMAQLPEREQQAEQISLSDRHPKSRLVALRPWLYAAACTVAVVVMGLTFYSHDVAEEQPLASTSTTNTTTNTESQYIDDAADYVMLDNAEIYACLAEN
jgi:hypothetical protein